MGETCPERDACWGKMSSGRRGMLGADHTVERCKLEGEMQTGRDACYEEMHTGKNAC